MREGEFRQKPSDQLRMYASNEALLRMYASTVALLVELSTGLLELLLALGLFKLGCIGDEDSWLAMRFGRSTGASLQSWIGVGVIGCQGEVSSAISEGVQDC